MKKLLFLSAIIVAFVFSSCSSGGYKSYVPADSKLVAKIDLKGLLTQIGVDQEKFMNDLLKMAGKDAKDLQNLGIDPTAPIYIFGKNKGNDLVFGAVAKVTNREMAEQTFTKESNIQLQKGDGYSFLDAGESSFAINDDALVITFNSSSDKNATKSNLMSIMKQETEGEANPNNLFAQADGNNSFASLYLDMSIIPDQLFNQAKAQGALTDEDIKAYRSMVMGLNGSASDGVCDFLYSVSASDPKAQETIAKAKKAYGFISDKVMNSFTADDMFGLAMNVNGKQLMNLIKESLSKMSSNPQMGQVAGIINQVSAILSKIEGNIVCSFNSPEDFTVKAEGKNITNDIVNFMNTNQMSGMMQLKNTGNGYSINAQMPLYFGYEGNNFYVTSNQGKAAQPSQLMGTPAPEALTKLMKDRKMVIFANTSQLPMYAAMFAGEDPGQQSLIKTITDKIKYVTFSYK